ncbi:MAG TPA: serine hydrolase domain-containing protein [Gaiellales bacterium]|nr:serine hydrolase domain-containing protein [Gaiellales bacterium]
MTDSPVGEVAARLESAATEFVREHRLPGLAAAIVHGDHLAWSAAPGFADVAARRRPNTATLYRIASITKTFTATLIMQLRDEGRLALDDPAVEHLPELSEADSAVGPISAVTIRRMLSHESGLLGDPPGTDWSSATYEEDPVVNLARADQIGLRVPPNTQQKYSNLAYQLLGEIVARTAGAPYAEVLRARLLTPLRMASTGFDPLGGELDARKAVGYAPRAFSDDLRPSIFTAISQAEGGLWSCVDDLTRWLAFQLAPDGDGRDRILAHETRAEMQRPRYLGDAGWTEAWAIGWYALRRDDVIWVTHSGGLHGFISNVCFDPEHRVGAIVLINGIANAGDLAVRLGAIARQAVAEHPVAIEPPPELPDEWAPLLGLYTDSEWMVVFRLEWRDGGLVWVDPDEPSWRPRLRPVGEQDAFLIEPGVRESGEPCVFHRRGDGTVTGARLGPVELQRLAPVEPGR